MDPNISKLPAKAIQELIQEGINLDRVRVIFVAGDSYAITIELTDEQYQQRMAETSPATATKEFVREVRF